MIYVNSRAIIERDTSNGIEIIVQLRTKPGQLCYEFPGGRINTYESFFEAVIREVKEETGLDVVSIAGRDNCVLTKGINTFEMECFQPYAVYQTLQGPVDSMGVYFRCKAEGELLDAGDDTKDIKWVPAEYLRDMIEEKGMFSDIDRAAALYYLKDIEK